MKVKMKDSGIEWIGEIPEDWKVVYLSSICSEHKRKNTGLVCKNLLSLSYGEIKRKDINTTDGLLPESFEGYNIIEKGDIVLRLTDLQNDQRSLRTGIAHETGLITSAYVTIRCLPNVACPYYIHYYLHSFDISKGFYGMGDGVRQGLNYAGIRKIMMLIPPMKTQQQIAAYLDKKCALVERLIENQRRQIEKLKEYKQSVITETVTKGLDHSVPMKDSGIEWIGKIPEDWKIARLKYVCKINPSINLDVSEYEFVGYVPMECVKNGYVESREIAIQQLNSGLTAFKNGDIVMAKVTPCFENGNIAIVSDLKNGVGYGSSELFVFRPIAIRTKFLFYFLRNHLFMEYAKSTMTGTGGLKRVSPTFIKSLRIACPNVSEQQQIAAYLDKKCAEIDALIAIKQQKIDKLQEYKKSLIYEYVTGKKEVL